MGRRTWPAHLRAAWHRELPAALVGGAARMEGVRSGASRLSRRQRPWRMAGRRTRAVQRKAIPRESGPIGGRSCACWPSTWTRWGDPGWPRLLAPELGTAVWSVLSRWTEWPGSVRSRHELALDAEWGRGVGKTEDARRAMYFAMSTRLAHADGAQVSEWIGEPKGMPCRNLRF